MSSQPARRILMTTDAVGGVWVYATELASGLARRGHDVTLVTLGPPPSPAQREAVRQMPGVDLITTDLALEWMDGEGADARRANDELLRIAEGRAPDLVHLNTFREGAIAWPVPALVVAHSCVTSWWLACRGRLPDEPRWARYVECANAGLRAADAWVAPTEWFRRMIQQLYETPTDGRVIYNGIGLASAEDSFSVRRRETGDPESERFGLWVADGAATKGANRIHPYQSGSAKKPVILASGRFWDEAKNLAALVAVAPALPWPVEVAGPLAPPQSPDPVLDAQNVESLGVLARPALRARMAEAAIYVAPARYEPFGLGVLEAAAAGCALVLADIPSLRELWDGAAAFVPPEDRDGLRAVLERLCRDAAWRRDLETRARARAQRYPISATIDGYEALYAELLSPSGRRHARTPREVQA